jgi:hypothetical protein
MDREGLKMSDFPLEQSEMSSVAEASKLVRRVAEPRSVGDSVKAAIARAARRIGFHHSRTKDIWYAHARRIDAYEMDRLREEAGRVEARIAVAHLLGLRNSLAATDPNFHRPQIAALDDALRALGSEGCPVAVRTHE